MSLLHRPAKTRATRTIGLVHVKAGLLHQELHHVGVTLHAPQVICVATVTVALASFCTTLTHEPAN